MIYLLLSLVLGCLVYIAFKIAAIRQYDGSRITLCNYFVAAILSILAAFSKGQHTIFLSIREGCFAALTSEKTPGNTAVIVLLIGLVSGIAFAVNLFQTKDSIALNGTGITSFFKQVGFIGGLFVAILFWGETPTLIQWIGIVTMLTALALMITDFRSLEIRSSKVLFALLVSGTIVESDNKFFSQFALGGYQSLMLAVAFSVAFVYTVCHILVSGKPGAFRFTRQELLCGGVLGLSNLLNNYFKLKSLEVLPAVVVIPTISAGTLILTALLGALLFKEKTNKQYTIAMLVAAVSIVLLNYQNG